MTDPLGRPVLSDALRTEIAATLAGIPQGKRGALVIVATEHGATAHLAAKIGSSGDWKIAAGAGVPWRNGKPSGWVVISGAW